ncbi:MAG: helix-turn-helix domain-containing protein [Burkholderiales bacterium]|nr:helix-turn-helix domain-containing protein [Burkholderiales bacterium]
MTPPRASPHQSFTTADVPPDHEFGYWRDVIASAYFNLQLSFEGADRFAGRLDRWDMGGVQLSRLESNRLAYRRLRQHCQAQERQVLVTVPFRSEVEFSQLGRRTRCAPGSYLLELSEEPYEFGHGGDNAMWVLKVPVAALKARIGEPSRFCARPYDSSQGVGRLFSDYLQLATRHCEQAHDASVMSLMGSQLVELLAVSLQGHPDALQSSHSAVRDAHLARIEAYVHQHLDDPELAPQQIADACGISLRYLHLLFKDTDESLSQWIRDQRLQLAHERLAAAAPRTSIAQIAYGLGFGDQAQFSHAFRRRYGYPPSELLRARRPEEPALSPPARAATRRGAGPSGA